jgi:hypothetical protein
VAETHLFALLTRYFSQIRERFDKLDWHNQGDFVFISQKCANYFSSFTDASQNIDLQGEMSVWSEGEFVRFFGTEEPIGIPQPTGLQTLFSEPGLTEGTNHVKQLLEMFSLPGNHDVSRVYLLRTNSNVSKATNLSVEEVFPTTQT